MPPAPPPPAQKKKRKVLSPTLTLKLRVQNTQYAVCRSSRLRIVIQILGSYLVVGYLAPGGNGVTVQLSSLERAWFCYRARHDDGRNFGKIMLVVIILAPATDVSGLQNWVPSCNVKAISP